MSIESVDADLAMLRYRKWTAKHIVGLIRGANDGAFSCKVLLSFVAPDWRKDRKDWEKLADLPARTSEDLRKYHEWFKGD